MKKVKTMSFLEIFILLENKIEKLSLLKKIKFYSIPILLCVLILILINDKNSFNFFIKKENKFFSKNQMLIIKDFTKYFNKNNINLQEIKQINQQIKLVFFSNLIQFIKTIHYLETYDNFSYIEQIEFLKKENHFLISLTVGFGNFYLYNKSFKLKDFKEEEENLTFKIESIVMNYVFIENKWYTIGDSINSYKIISISNNFIEFQKDNKIQKVFFYE